MKQDLILEGCLIGKPHLSSTQERRPLQERIALQEAEGLSSLPVVHQELYWTISELLEDLHLSVIGLRDSGLELEYNVYSHDNPICGLFGFDLCVETGKESKYWTYMIPLEDFRASKDSLEPIVREAMEGTLISHSRTRVAILLGNGVDPRGYLAQSLSILKSAGV